MWFERRCQACGQPAPLVCGACVAALEAPAAPRLVLAGPVVCRSLFGYQASGRDLVVALKYRNGRALGAWLGAAMADLVEVDSVDVVTWAPTSRARRHHRGYDQSRLLARTVAGALGLPCRGLLRRRPGPPQTGAGLAERQVGPTFTVVRPAPGRVLVVDDVVTTGATLAAAASALRRGGAERVTAVTAAATPRRRPSPQGERGAGRE